MICTYVALFKKKKKKKKKKKRKQKTTCGAKYNANSKKAVLDLIQIENRGNYTFTLSHKKNYV